MQRWHVTVGLTCLALAAALVAPRLMGSKAAPAPIEPRVDPILTRPPPAERPELPLGHLEVSAGLDRPMVAAGAASERYLTVRVTAPGDLGGASHAVDLSVVMDVSGSMSARGKIDEAKRAAGSLASAMRPGDTWSLVVFNDDATVVVPATGVEDLAAIHRAVDRIYEGGGTNLYAGLEKGARELRGAGRDGSVSRMVLLSDGKANVGVTDPGALGAYAEDLAARGVTVSALGLGADFEEDLLARLADLGGGTYRYVEDAAALGGLFEEELRRSAAVVASQTWVHVELPPHVEPLGLLGWEARRSGRGWDVFLGDVHAGETRTVVARVRVADPGGPGEAPVAEVDVRYLDRIDARDAHTPASAAARRTGDRAAAERTVDPERAAEAARARSASLLDRSTEAFARGEPVRARALAADGARSLREEAEALGVPELAAEADRLEAVAAPMVEVAPGSEAGRIQIKRNKELSRDLSR